ncbi:MAG: hypothetical protein KC662_03590, partial [Candidatus Magasanikbacteria bacterium]|nr:hypothetical protein [Candidatus Magasanikbacteria bacterium]
VQNATTPSYCSTEQAAAPAVAAPQPRTAAPAAPAPAPAASAPAVAATPALPPYASQGMFQGQSYSQVGECPSSFATYQTFLSAGVSEAIWYTPGTRQAIINTWQRWLAQTGQQLGLLPSGVMPGNIGGGFGVQVTEPMTITIRTAASQYWMVITVNGREVRLIRNGQALSVVQEMRNGQHCIRSALPAQTATSFIMELEGNRPDVEIGVYLYLPTASGALGALVPVPGNLRTRTYQISDLVAWGREIVISSTDGGMVVDR